MLLTARINSQSACLEAATKCFGWTELAASPVRNELIPQKQLSMLPLTSVGTVCVQPAEQISWNTCSPAVAKSYCPILTAGEWHVLSLCHLQLALPCRTDVKSVTLCSCLQHTVFTGKLLFLHFIQHVSVQG